MSDILLQESLRARDTSLLFRYGFLSIVAVYFLWPYQGNPTLLLVGKALLALLAFSLFFDLPQVVKRNLLHRILLIGSLGFVVFAYLSVFFSVEPERTLKHVTEEVFLNMLVFWGVFLWSHRFDPVKKKLLFWSVGLSFLFMVLFYFLLVLWWAEVGPVFARERAPSRPDLLSLLFFLPDWQTLLLNRQNLASYFLFPATMSWSYFLVARDNMRYRYLAFALFLVFGLVLFLTNKRSALLGLFLAVLLTLFLLKRIKILVGIILCAFLMTFLVLNTPVKRFFVRENLSVLLKGDKKQWKKAGSIPVRYYGLPFYLKEIKKHPLQGVGFGVFNIKSNPRTKEISKKSRLAHAHNTFVNFALFMGLPGLLFFGLFLMAQIIISFKSFYQSNEVFVRWLALGFIAYFFSFWIRYQFDDTFRHAVAAFYYLNSGLVLGLIQRDGKDTSSTS